jgi:thiol-disulfide isomerase/thioredoxin
MDVTENSSKDKSLIALIVCATWCAVCRDYKSMVEGNLEITPIWVDVDDFETIADEISIETFPTIVILDGVDVLFFGSIDAKQDALPTLISAVSKHTPMIQYRNLGEAIKHRFVE